MKIFKMIFIKKAKSRIKILAKARLKKDRRIRRKNGQIARKIPVTNMGLFEKFIFV